MSAEDMERLDRLVNALADQAATYKVELVAERKKIAEFKQKALPRLDTYYSYDTQSDIDAVYKLIEEL